MKEIEELLILARNLDAQGKPKAADGVDRRITAIAVEQLRRFGQATPPPPLPQAAWQQAPQQVQVGTQPAAQQVQVGTQPAQPQQPAAAQYMQQPDGSGGVYITDQQGKQYYHIPANQVAQQQAYIQQVTGQPAPKSA